MSCKWGVRSLWRGWTAGRFRSTAIAIGSMTTWGAMFEARMNWLVAATRTHIFATIQSEYVPMSSFLVNTIGCDEASLVSWIARGTKAGLPTVKTLYIVHSYLFYQLFSRGTCDNDQQNVEVVGEKRVGRGKKTWRECVNDDMILLGLLLELAVFKAMWRGFISGQTSDPSWAWKKLMFQNDDDNIIRLDNLVHSFKHGSLINIIITYKRNSIGSSMDPWSTSL